MKKLVLMTMVVIGALTVQAKKPLYYIDMTGKNFVDDNLNEYGDGFDFGNYSGFGIQLDGELGHDFTYEARGSESHVTCKLKVVKRAAAKTYFSMQSNVEIDSGETCEYIFTKHNGEQATLTVYQEGT